MVTTEPRNGGVNRRLVSGSGDCPNLSEIEQWLEWVVANMKPVVFVQKGKL